VDGARQEGGCGLSGEEESCWGALALHLTAVAVSVLGERSSARLLHIHFDYVVCPCFVLHVPVPNYLLRNYLPFIGKGI
jgi:hypothetical protein